MKFSPFLFMVLALSSGNALAAVDYSYCQKQFNNYTQPNKPCKLKMGMFNVCTYGTPSLEKTDDSSYYPFELTAEGKIKPHPTLNFKTENGKEVVYFTNNDMDYESVITRNEKGEISDISTNYNMKTLPGGGYGGGFGGTGGGYPGMPKATPSKFTRKNETNTKLEIKNGKCIPSRLDSVNSIGDESRQDVLFDAKLCRNVSQFFKKNPEAASCFDKKLIEKAQGLFNDFYEDNKDVYGDFESSPYSMKPKTLKTNLKSDLSSGGMYGYPGTGGYGMGMGMGMGMPGATVDQMLQPMMPSIDTALGGSPFTLGGAVNSSVIKAKQIMDLCQGGGFGPNPLFAAIEDESVWATAPAATTEKAVNLEK